MIIGLQVRDMVCMFLITESAIVNQGKNEHMHVFLKDIWQRASMV